MDPGGDRTGAERLWRRMRPLLEQSFDGADRDALVDEALDAILEVAGADRGLVQLIEPGGELHIINARGQGRALSAWEREEVSKTLLAEVRARGELVATEPGAAAPDAESLVTLGIVAALAAPITGPGGAGERHKVRGVLYLDYRERAPAPGGEARELVELGALHLSALVAQRRSLAAAAAAAAGRAGAAGKELARGEAAPMPTIDELLRPDSLAPLRREVATSLRSGAPVLITGESGTGKTLLASAIAHASGRTPIVRAMLGTSDDLNTVTSELFGHERGSFSGAVSRRAGLVEFADGGTLILDEILNLHATAQQLLLDFTQFGTYRPLGHDRGEPRRARVRLIACTNGDLRAAVRAGRFREDLYYRLAGVRLHVPPLRARRADLPGMAEAYLRRLDPGRPWQLAVPVRRLLLSPELHWPGNVRQLETVVSRARDRALERDPAGARLVAADVAADDLGDIGVGAAEAGGGAGGAPGAAELAALDPAEAWRRLGEHKRAHEAAERAVIERALADARGVVGVAARALGIGRTSLLSRMRTLKLRA